MGVRSGTSWGSAVGMALLCVVGCGGRTSTLDPNAYSEDEVVYDDDDVIAPGTGGRPGTNGPPPTGGTGIGAAGTATGGRPAAGGSTAAGGSVGTAGTTAAGGIGPGMPGSTATACLNYCSGYERACAKELEGRDCFGLCAGEVDGFGAGCQRLGVKALSCLTPYFQTPGLSCDESVAAGVGQCATAVSRFQQCKLTQAPTPTPTPNPVPLPPEPQTCAGGSGQGDQYYCSLSVMCSDGNYSVDCKWQGNGNFECYCYWPDSFNSLIVVSEASMNACYTAAQICGLPL